MVLPDASVDTTTAETFCCCPDWLELELVSLLVVPLLEELPRPLMLPLDPLPLVLPLPEPV